jgi:hypothetical protein
VRTTLQIDEDVLDEARQIAAADRRSLGAVISELARRALQPVDTRDEAGFPVFDVDPNAPAITARVVASALDDE